MIYKQKKENDDNWAKTTTGHYLTKPKDKFKVEI